MNSTVTRKYAFINNTNEDVRMFDAAILEAIKNNGVFSEKSGLAETFSLSCPAGEWLLDLVD